MLCLMASLPSCESRRLPRLIISGAINTVYGYYTLVEVSLLVRIGTDLQTRPPASEKVDLVTGIKEKRRPSGSMADTLKVPGFLLITVIFCCRFIGRNNAEW